MQKNKIFKIIIIFLLLIAIFQSGSIGKILSYNFKYILGNTFFLFLIIIILFIITTFFKKRKRKQIIKYVYAILLMLIAIDLLITYIKIYDKLDSSEIFNQIKYEQANINDKIGLIQTNIIYFLNKLFGIFGIYIGTSLLFVIGIFLILDFDEVFKSVINKINILKKENKKQEKENKKQEKENKKQEKENKKQEKENKKQEKENKKQEKENKKQEKENKKQEKENKKQEKEPIENLFDIPPQIKGLAKSNQIPEKKLENKNNFEEKEKISISSKQTKNKLPTLSLLTEQKKNKEIYAQLNKNAENKVPVIEETLKSFNVEAEVKNIVVGTTVTRYELQPQKGQKVNKFLTLSNDLSMALEAESIRIEAPIPGKSLVGIEVPNETKITIGLKEVLENLKSRSKLSIALGQDITGETRELDIAKTPHMLVAGATGSGKSVCINSILISILYNATPEEVKFLLIDPKKVELTPYNNLPHLITPVITDAEIAATALNKLVLEMEKRYELFAETATRNIISYNEKQNGENKMPYIVAVIDELADLMMVASKDVETAISRIAQKARAAGIHLILATQRPSTDVITGLIKSNIPTRLSFMVSSSIDSRTILGVGGAEKLLGNGDMLLSEGGKPKLDRIQGVYLSDEEIINVVDSIKEQYKKEPLDKYQNELFLNLENETKQEKKEISEEQDPLFKEALVIAIEEQKISTSLIQRRLKVGYNRAYRIIEQLEDRNYISKQEGNKGRKILIDNINEIED